MKAMRRILSILAAMALIFSSLPELSAFAETKQVLRVYNWGEYISVADEDGYLDVIAEFERTHPGVEVEYTTFASNEEMYAKIKSGSANYDVIIPSDYMIARMSEEGLLAELNFDNIPNFSYIDERFLNPDYDPENKYSVPYTWGTVGIIYNTAKITDEITSWSALWDEKYAGKILMFDNPRDAFAIACERLGYSINTTDEEELNQAANLLMQQKGVLQAYVMDQIFNKMESNEAWIAPYYAGDAIVMMEENPDLAFVIPSEGSNIFVDAMCVLESSKQKDLAEEFINFMADPEIMSENISYIGYSSPETAARELLDEDLRDSTIAYPSDEATMFCEFFVQLPEEINEKMEDFWISVKASDGSTETVTVGGDHTAFWIILGLIVLICAFLNIWIRVRKHQAKQSA
jgi:spermidine/putrescine transport system substrate-binding protein